MAEPPVPSLSPTFLGIPLESRRMIFLNMITWSAYDHGSMLCTSKQMRNECQESFDLRRVRYPSQSTFVKKARTLSPFVLKNTDKISICFEGNDIFRFMDNDISRFSLVPTSLQQRLVSLDLAPNLGSDDLELDLLYQALSQFPNLRTFVVAVPSNSTPSSASYLNQLFIWLGNNHGAIEALGMGIPCNMNVLLNFTQLRELSFSGFSTVNERQLGYVFTQLRHLETLEIICQKTSVTQSGAKRIAPSVISRIRPLKRLSIREEYKYEDESSSSYGFVDSKNLCEAFQKIHGKSLESLTVSSRINGGRSGLEPMYSLIPSATSLKTLTLELWDFDATFLWKLPSSLEKLDLSLRGKHLGVEQAYFKSLHDKLPLLEGICFRLSPVVEVMDGNVVKSREEKEVYKFETWHCGKSRSAEMGSGLAEIGHPTQQTRLSRLTASVFVWDLAVLEHEGLMRVSEAGNRLN